MFHKRDPGDGADEVAVRADAVLAVIAGARQGSAIILRDSEQTLGVAEDVRTVVSRVNAAINAECEAGNGSAQA
jgi:hypothetical protein